MLPDVQRHPWHTTDHHTARGFRTPWTAPTDAVPPLRAARWMVTYALRRKPAAEPTPFRLLDPRTLRRAPQGGSRIAWLGHATFLIQLGGVTILTDPVFSERVSPFSFAGPKREVPLPVPLDGLPRVDVVLLSHDHYDHLDPAALARLARRDDPLVLAPLGVGRHVPSERVREMDWGEFVALDGLRLHATPAKHFSGRWLHDRDRSLWASWLIEPDDGPRVYWAGDSGYSPHFGLIRERHGAPDVVLMPVGAFAPRWLMRPVHVDPEEAVRAYLDLGGAETGAPLVPFHWGTFDLAEEPLDAPPQALREAAEAAGVADALRVLPVGGLFEPVHCATSER